MSRRHRSWQHRGHWRHWHQAFRGWLARTIADLSRHRKRTGAFAAACVVLVWLIVTKSLPYALAERAPQLALWLDPDQPVALLVVANQARAALLSLPTPVADKAAGKANSLAGGKGNLLETTASLPPSSEPEANAQKREALRSELRNLVGRILASDPLNARAIRMLAEVTDDPAQARSLMEEALRRSRRESAAALWLMNDSFARQDFGDVVEKADILLRTREQLTLSVMNYLGKAASVPEGRRALVALLAKQPKWRRPFFSVLPKSAPKIDTPLHVMLALKEAGSPPSNEELSSYLSFLVHAKAVDLAYNAWLQLMPQDKLTTVGLLNNAAFASDPTGMPFDWSIKRGQNTIVDFVPSRDGSSGRALRIGFGVGRIRFPETTQVLLLTAGRYRLEGAFQGAMAARRGLRWEIRCLDGKNTLAETDMIFGHPRNWQGFTLDVEVPDRQDCRAQELRLYHHARSPSEEMISGEIFFRDLRLVRVEQG